jgi:signal transduction histidine kinase
MLAEILIFVPAVADYRRNWLMRRIVAAKIASLALEASNGAELPKRLRKELLATAGVHAVSLKRYNMRQLVLEMPEDHEIADTYDLRAHHMWKHFIHALSAFVAPPGRFVRVIASPDMAPDEEVDIVIDETPLRAALWGFAGNILWVSLFISVLTAALVYWALTRILVRPMMRLTHNMTHYRENPHDLSRVIVPCRRSDEIGIAEKELAALQTQLSEFLREKTRLADIGLAVSKINHDLRNMLSGAQILSDRLATISDPRVQHFAPRLIRALDRAITLCVDTLKYGRSEEAPPKRTQFPLRPLLTELKESLGMEELEAVHLTFAVPPTLVLWADRDQIFRVLSNLIRNAVEVLRKAEPPIDRPVIAISAVREENHIHIRVSDNGPGVPAQMRPGLFKAFQSTSQSEGHGLGLVICAELIRAHGGEISLEDAYDGATFVLKLPALPEGTRHIIQSMDRLAKAG